MMNFEQTQDYQGFFENINTQSPKKEYTEQGDEALSYKDFVEELKRAKKSYEYEQSPEPINFPSEIDFPQNQLNRKFNMDEIFEPAPKKVNAYEMPQVSKAEEPNNQLILEELRKNNELLLNIAKAIQEITKIPHTINTNSDNIITEVSEHNYYVNKLISKIDQLTQNIANKWIEGDSPKKNDEL